MPRKGIMSQSFNIQSTPRTYEEKYEGDIELGTILWQRFNDLKREMKVQLPCEVLKVDNVNNQVEIKILDYDADEVGGIQNFPAISNVPIRQSQESGAAYIRLPVQIGDTGTIEFFDSTVDSLITSGTYDYDIEEEWHSLSDGLFTNGFLIKDKIYNVEPNNPITIGTKDTIFTLYVDEFGKLTIDNLNDIIIRSGTNIELDAPTTTVTGNLSAGTGFSGIAPTGSTLVFDGGVCVSIIQP